MTAKEYLSRIRRQKYILEQVEKEMLEVRSDILTLRASSLSEKVTGTKDSDLADSYIKLEKYFEEVNTEWDKLIDKRREAKALIKMLPDAQQQAILYARYINCEDWEKIAVEMHFSWRNIFYLHGKALQAFGSLHRIALAKGV